MFESSIVNRDEELIEMKDMKPCQLGVVDDERYRGRIVMRTASENTLEVMDLTKAGGNACWEGSPPVLVRLLPKGTKIILEVK